MIAVFRGFKKWVERSLEKPFFEAEMMRVEVLKQNKTKTLRLTSKPPLTLKEARH